MENEVKTESKDCFLLQVKISAYSHRELKALVSDHKSLSIDNFIELALNYFFMGCDTYEKERQSNFIYSKNYLIDFIKSRIEDTTVEDFYNTGDTNKWSNFLDNNELEKYL